MAKIKRNKPHWFYEELYGVNFYFMPGFSQDDLNHSIMTMFGVERKSRFGYGGCAIDYYDKSFTKYGIYIWLDTSKKDAYTLGNLHHECIHAANMVLNRAGVMADHENDEPLAYLSSWIFKKCLGKLK